MNLLDIPGIRRVHPAYEVGPVLEANVDPWEIQWEMSDVVLACEHDVWESVLLKADGENRVKFEEVVRCRACHAPRCGGARENNPCVLVRHHRDLHVHAAGGR